MTELIGPGLYTDLSNQDYHQGPGISKSGLDLIADSPATYRWHQQAPLDPDAGQAFELGTALHCLLLEPDEFEARFMIAPPFNRRTKAGKEAEAAFLAEMAEAGKTIMTAEDGKKLRLMRDSVMAHQDARLMLEADGQCEASIYWEDPDTGELCRIRPDKHLVLNDQPIILDVKTVADFGRAERGIEEFRYHVQDAMYCEGYRRHFGTEPLFAFLAVSTSLNCQRYPVRVRPLEEDWRAAGAALFRRDLDEYHRCRIENDWHDFIPYQRPAWAKRAA